MVNYGRRGVYTCDYLVIWFLLRIKIAGKTVSKFVYKLAAFEKNKCLSSKNTFYYNGIKTFGHVGSCTV